MLKFKQMGLCLRIIGGLMDSGGNPVYGLREHELAVKVGLDVAGILEAIKELIEKDVIEHFISQEGTSGPYAHRYRLSRGVVVSVEVTDSLKRPQGILLQGMSG